VKVVILAGGLGTRLAEETQVRPKPMAEIGDHPMLWHIMKIYSHYGYNEFVICLGYKGFVVKEYFSNYFLHNCDVTFDMASGAMEVHQQAVEPWKVTLVDTGAETQTGGRLKRVAPFMAGQTFMVTYGDGVGDVDIAGLVAFHRSHGKLATMTAVQPLGRFGAVELGADAETVTSFKEKPLGDGAWVNGGFFVLEPAVLEHIGGDGTAFEREPLEALAGARQLRAYKHRGFWQPMDTLRDKRLLEEMWATGKAPWKVW
jgi:glucose-1-phosphate cytidylyltransferase